MFDARLVCRLILSKETSNQCLIHCCKIPFVPQSKSTFVLYGRTLFVKDVRYILDGDYFLLYCGEVSMAKVEFIVGPTLDEWIGNGFDLDEWSEMYGDFK